MESYPQNYQYFRFALSLLCLENLKETLWDLGDKIKYDKVLGCADSTQLKETAAIKNTQLTCHILRLS